MVYAHERYTIAQTKRLAEAIRVARFSEKNEWRKFMRRK